MTALRYSLVVALCALAIPVAANANTIVNNTGGPVDFVDLANASPYPDKIDISGGDGPITKVVARMTISKSWAEDVDVALVSPSGAASILMSDRCGPNPITNLTFTFDDELGVGTLPTSGCATATYQTTNFDAGDNWPAPGPGTGLSPNLDNFNGSSANGDWKLFALDDASLPGGAQGSISSWGLTITTSHAQIVMPANPVATTSGVAGPYPSLKTFDTAVGQVIDDVNLRILGFNHEHPADVDMMLQGPTGETVMVMSDACGSTDINTNFNYTFDDESLLSFGDGVFTNCSPGSIRPSDFADPPESLPAPALPRPYGTTMSVFDGLPGGDYRLFINDDSGSDTGYINDWNLEMTTRPPAATGFAATAVPTAEGQTAQLAVNRTGSANLGAATVDLSVVDGETDSRDFGHALPTKLEYARGEASKTISIPINADLEGEGAEAFQVALADSTGDAKLAAATSIAKVTIAESAPDNRFTVGDATKNSNGTAQIPVTIPGPGQLTSDDAGTKDQLKTIGTFAEAGTTILKIKPAKNTKRKLNKGKKVKLTAEITYTPTGGSANSTDAPVKLKKKP